MRVLVVDDEPEIAHALARLIQAMGHEVRTAWTALAAVSELDTERFELVLVDWNLAGTMTGVEVARYARRKHPESATVLCSGYSLSHMRAGWTDPLSGMLAFLEKPIDAEKLKRIVGVVKDSLEDTGH